MLYGSFVRFAARKVSDERIIALVLSWPGIEALQLDWNTSLSSGPMSLLKIHSLGEWALQQNFHRNPLRRHGVTFVLRRTNSKFANSEANEQHALAADRWPVTDRGRMRIRSVDGAQGGVRSD